MMRVWGRNLSVIAHIQLHTRKGRFSIVQHSFRTYNIRIHLTVFELCMMKKEARKKEGKKEEEEQNEYFHG